MPYSYPQPIDRAQAFRQQPHLLIGGGAFAALAGFINSVALGFFHSPVSHMTGTVSYLGIELASHQIGSAVTTVSIVACFVLGSMLSGYLIGAHELISNPRFGAALFAEGALIALAMFFLVNQHRFGVLAIAIACGLQNATTSSYFGLGIRTTHLTGTVTDIGVMFGHWFKHRKIDTRKLKFMLLLVLSFAAGVWLGAVAGQHWGPRCLAIPAIGCCLAGVITMLKASPGQGGSPA